MIQLKTVDTTLPKNRQTKYEKLYVLIIKITSKNNKKKKVKLQIKKISIMYIFLN